MECKSSSFEEINSVKHTLYWNYFKHATFSSQEVIYFSTLLTDEMPKKAGTKTFLSQSDLELNKNVESIIMYPQVQTDIRLAVKLSRSPKIGELIACVTKSTNVVKITFFEYFLTTSLSYVVVKTRCLRFYQK